MEITHRGYRSGDVPQILELYKTVFADSRTASQWRWEYVDNPIGRCGMVLAFAGRRLIGHAAGVPLEFRHCEESVRMSRVQHAVVHPDFQRRGIFTQTLVRLTDSLAVGGVDLVVAFPHDGRHSMPGFMATGAYTHVFDIRPWGRAFPTTRQIPTNVRVEIDETVRFDAADVECAERTLAPFAICNRRDLHYLNWRYHRASGRRYTVVRVWRDGAQAGWVVAKPYAPARSLDLVECVLPTDPPLIAAVLAALAERFRGEAVDHFSLWSMEHYPMHASLLDLGFAAEPRPTHVLVAALSARCSSRSVEPSAYYLAMGDSDVY